MSPRPFAQAPWRGALVALVLILPAYFLVTGLVQVGIIVAGLFDPDLTGGLAAGFSSLDQSWVGELLGRYKILFLGSTIAGQFIFFWGGAALLNKYWLGEPFMRGMGTQVPRLGHVIFALIGLAGLFPLAMYTGEFAVRAFPFLKDLNDGTEQLILSKNLPDLLFTLVAIGLTPALCEEVLFRGFFQRHLAARTGSWSWFLGGTLFALIHQNWFGLVTLLVIGWYLSFVYHRTASLWLGSILHLVYNGVIVLMTNYPDWAEPLYDAEGFTDLRVVILGAAVATGGIGALILSTRRRPAPPATPPFPEAPA